MKHLFFTTLLCISSVLAAQIRTIEHLTNPKTVSEAFYVCNPDNILSGQAVTSINEVLHKVEIATSAEVAVVVIQSIGSAVPKDFATELFNSWGVGKKENDNGLLLLMVIDQRRIEFETGFGLEPILTDAVCKRIQVEHMVPYAKEAAYDSAILNGVSQLAIILTDPHYREEIFASSEIASTEKPFHRDPITIIPLLILGLIYYFSTLGYMKYTITNIYKKPDYIKKHLTKQYLYTKYYLLNFALPTGVAAYQYITGYFRIGEVLLFVYAMIAILLFEKRLRIDTFLKIESQTKSPYQKYILYNSANRGWGIATLFVPIPFLAYWVVLMYKKRSWRNTPPVGSCRDMIKLNEKADNAYLKMFELTEETLKTVDYDVWKCKDSEHVTILRYPNNQTKYTSCPTCTAIALYVSAKHTVTSATYQSTGVGEKIYQCKFCNYTKTETYTIPQLTQTTISSNNYSGGGGGNGSGGGGGYSGGGGFGGGGSGGGGAGSSW
jgi:uncharacterized protein